MGQDVYYKLREFMDNLPAGYPETPTGVEIKILKKLYPPEQAELLMKLRDIPEEVSVIASRTGMDEEELSNKLEDMAQKGLIFRVRDGDRRFYVPMQFLMGVYEYQLNNLDRELCELFEAYLPYIGMSWVPLKTSQLRIIPLESSVRTTPAVATYNRIRDLVRQQRLISVQECICRKEQAILGSGCNQPLEVCMGFGMVAQFYIENGLGSSIGPDEALRILDLAEASGLVLTPTNSKDLLSLCCCCPCCCPNLKYAKMMSRPADFVRSYYEAKIDPERCTQCESCMERCPMNAIKANNGGFQIISGRCIGCGLCVSTCPSEAISMTAKPNVAEPPENFLETLLTIKSERGILQAQ